MLPTPPSATEAADPRDTVEAVREHHGSGSGLLECVGLIGTVAAFVALLTYFGELRAENFFAYNWDLGINQQMLWTTAHGQILYEAGDFEFYGVHSFLQVHSTYLAFLIVPVYAVAPFPGTLFAVQSAAFASSVIPLYYIARSVLSRRALAYGAILVYLASFAVVSALLYDFHWEAFVPLEFLSLFWLVQRRRYAWSLAPLLAGVLTLEVFTFLVGGIVLFFLWDRLDRESLTWRKLWKNRDARLLAGLFVIAVVSYVGLRVLQYLVVPHLIGVPGSTTGASSSLLSPFVITAKPATLVRGALYWWLLLACFGFLPLLSARHLILSLPWFVETMLFTPSFASQFGNQYALLAVAGLAVPFVYGLAKLDSTGITSPYRARIVVTLLGESGALAALAVFPVGSRGMLSGAPTLPVVALLVAGPFAALVLLGLSRLRRARRPVEAARPTRARIRQGLVPMMFGTLAVVLVFNAAMSPVNTSNFDATPYPGYHFQWGENPVTPHMTWLVGFLPRDAQVLASDNLFPFVANNPNAYAIPWFAVDSVSDLPHFPFSSGDLPTFVLVDSSQFSLLPSFLAHDLFQRSVYGLVADVYTTSYPGSVFLYERGYTGPIHAQEAVSPPSLYYFTFANLSLGPWGTIAPSSSAKFGKEIESRNLTQPGNNTAIWYGPYVDLVPGAYRVVFNVSGLASAPTEPLAELSVGVYFTGQALANLTWSVVYSDQLASVDGTRLSYDITLNETLPLVEFRGFLARAGGAPNGVLSLNYIEVDRLA